MTTWAQHHADGTNTVHEVSDWQVARWDAKTAAKGLGKSRWVRSGKIGTSELRDRLVRDADGFVLATVGIQPISDEAKDEIFASMVDCDSDDTSKDRIRDRVANWTDDDWAQAEKDWLFSDEE